MGEFSCVGLIGRIQSKNVGYSLEHLISFLEGQDLKVLLEEDTATIVPNTTLACASRNTLAEKCDLVIVVGGDGSILSAARTFAGCSAKILGINRGRLGFLTDIRPEDIEAKVGEVLNGHYVVEQRFMLEASLYRDDRVIAVNTALNDVVIHPGQFIRMVDLSLNIDGKFVYDLRSDGLIISSPTGSTAYALSGGGPIMHPHLDALVLVPMNAHTLSSRPIVVKGDSRIEVEISKRNDFEPHITCDGQNHAVSQAGDHVIVQKSDRLLQLIHPEGNDFYEACRTKLGWAR